ncbi:Yip1 family protein [Paenibacillus caui]|uniref:Yip1 family protein n=1 Tax=Paenibacillus caui TaxID=2873927 RepID=UPI001CA81A48|nr:Yip1 family protein [Paenibacillus caui]
MRAFTPFRGKINPLQRDQTMRIFTLFRGKINPLRCLIHPFDGFYAVKEDRKGSIPAAGIIVFVFFLSALMERQNSGFIFNYADPAALNVWLIATKTIVLFVLWVVCNWAVATWMEGEGKAAEIVIISAYSLIPYVIATLITIFFSNVLLREEGAFLYYMMVVGLIWSSILMVIGMGIIHDYGFVRTLQSILLTFAAMGIVVFLAVLFYTLFQQLYVFLYTIYNELLFRA